VPRFCPLLILAICLEAATARLVRSEQPLTDVETAPGRRTVPRLDGNGVPLPAGAIARWGTTRPRGFSLVTFSPDGKAVAWWFRDGLVTIQKLSNGPSTEGECYCPKLPGSRLFSLSLQPGDRSLAVVGGPDGSVYLWDFASGEKPPPLGQPGATGSAPRTDRAPPETYRCFAASPDGKVLAGGLAGSRTAAPRIRLWEVATGKELRQLKPLRQLAEQGPGVCWMGFSASGKVLAAASEDGTFCLWQVGTGRQVTRFQAGPPAPQAGLQGIALSPDGKSMAQAMPNHTISLWDVERGKQLHRLRGHTAEVRALTFSADSRMLVSAGRDQLTCLWEVASGRKSRTENRINAGVETLALSPDGNLQATGGTDDLRGVHARNGGGWGASGVKFGIRRMALSPKGDCFATGDAGTARLWSVASGKVLRQFQRPQEVLALALSPDGRFLAVGYIDYSASLWEISTGKELRRWQWKAEELQNLFSLSFSPDGKTLASGLWGGNGGGQCVLWEVSSGKELKALAKGQRTFGLAFSADGRLVATTHPWDQFTPGPTSRNVICLWDTATGRRERVLQGHLFEAFHCALSPDGKVLASAGKAIARDPDQRRPGMPDSPDSPDLSEALHLWDVSRSIHLRQIPGDPVVSRPREGKVRFVGDIHFSPDGKGLAAAEGNDVILYETATGKVRLRLKGHHDGVVGVGFVRGGQVLVSASQDDTVLIWDLTGRLDKERLRPVVLSAAEVERLWGKLAGADAAEAYQAIWTLAAAPEAAVAFLKTKLRPVPQTDSGRIERLLADLDADDFKTRVSASREIEKLGELAEPALRKLLESQPSQDVQRAANELLAKQARAPLPPDRLQVLRAIETLEEVGSPAAKELLRALGAGASEARLTQEAKASLERLTRSKP
jgi:WD40 repeat protein